MSSRKQVKESVSKLAAHAKEVATDISDLLNDGGWFDAIERAEMLIDILKSIRKHERRLD